MAGVPSSDFQILPATWRDWWQVCALEKACFGPDAWGHLDVFLALLNGGTVRLKMMSAGRLVGFAIGEAHVTEGYAWIATLGIHPALQRRGLGRLLRATEAQLPTPLIKLTVRRSNAPAIALYEKFGYAPVHTWEGYYTNGEAGIVMEKYAPPN